MPSFGRVLEVLPDVGGVQQRLGGNAADVQAGAAQLGVFFNDGGFEAVLAGANGRRIATGSAPDDDHVISHFDFRITFAIPFLVSRFWFLVSGFWLLVAGSGRGASL